jgi:ubiquitin C-terminal hydrolase
MNACLQALSQVTELYHYFVVNAQHTSELNKTNFLASKDNQMTHSFASFLSQIYSGKEPVISPLQMKESLATHYTSFNNKKQQDANECCTVLLDALSEDLNRIRTKVEATEISERVVRRRRIGEEAIVGY